MLPFFESVHLEVVMPAGVHTALCVQSVWRHLVSSTGRAQRPRTLRALLEPQTSVRFLMPTSCFSDSAAVPQEKTLLEVSGRFEKAITDRDEAAVKELMSPKVVVHKGSCPPLLSWSI